MCSIYGVQTEEHLGSAAQQVGAQRSAHAQHLAHRAAMEQFVGRGIARSDVSLMD